MCAPIIGSFEQTFYLSTQLANRQHIAFHGDKGWIELTRRRSTPTLYEGDEVRLHARGHDHTEVFRFTGVKQYRLQVEAFVNAVSGGGSVFTLEESVLNQRVLDAVFASGRSGGWENV